MKISFQKILLLITILFLSLTNYAAIDTVTNTNTTGPGSLRITILNATNGDTIRFDPSLIINGSDTILCQGIRFSKSLTIIGLYNSSDTLYLSGDGARIFEITNTTNVTLDSLIMINGNGLGFYKSGYGGALLFKDSDTLLLNNSIIRACSSSNHGGGIFINSSTGKDALIIRNSIISENTTTNGFGGGIAYVGSTISFPYISSPGYISLTNSKLTYNTGSGIYTNINPTTPSYISVINSMINNNNGDGITSEITSEISIINSSVSNNRIGICSNNSYLLNISVIKSDIIGNSMEGIKSSGSSPSEIVVDSSNFNLNQGRALFTNIYNTNTGAFSTLLITNSTFNGNTGGGVEYRANPTVVAGSFFKVENSTFSNNNISSGAGAAIVCNSQVSEFTITNSNIINNIGGAIYSSKNLLVISNSNVNNNFSSASGGAIFADSVFINNSIVNNNRANGKGGAICSDLWGPHSYISILNTTMKWNKANSDGGAIYSYNTASASNFPLVQIDSSDISDNFSGNNGGAIYCNTGNVNDAAFVTINNSKINNNSAKFGGGISTIFLTLSNATINNNTASINGGGIYGRNVNCSNSTLSYNSALNDGGAIYYWNLSNLDFIINYSSLTNNTANDDGGGIYIESGSFTTIHMSHSTIAENTCINGLGGGIYCLTDSLFITNSTITGNDALSGNGAGIFYSCNNTFLQMQSSIMALNGSSNMYCGSQNPKVTSLGFNIFSNTPTGSIASDQIGITSGQLNLNPLGYYGGSTPTMSPNTGSVAINLGHPSDNSNAQNRPINGVRDVGAAEYCSQSTSSSINANACNFYIPPSGLYSWDSTGTYIDIIPNAAGCDSIITVNLIIDSSAVTLNPVACNSYISPSGNYIWTSSGFYMDTIFNSIGCDSIFYINLIVGQNPTDTTFNASSCTSYTSPSGNYIWTTNGTYKDTILNFGGCDSIITINLTINSLPTVSLPAFNPDSICQYQLPYSLTTGIPIGGTYSGFGVSGNTFNPSLIPGSYNITYTYTDSNNCTNTDSSLINLYICTGAEELNLLSGVKVFPNPYYESTTIQFEKVLSKDYGIVVNNVIGAEIFRLDNINSNKITLYKNDTGKGIFLTYLINLKNGKKFFLEKLVVQ